MGWTGDWSSDVCSSDLTITFATGTSLLNVNLNAPNVTLQASGSGTLNWQALTFQAGTINQGSVDFVFTSPFTNYDQSGGTFNGSPNAITFSNQFRQSGGTFNGNTGNIELAPAGEIFNNINFNLNDGQIRNLFGGSPVATGQLAFNDGKLGNNIIEGRAAVVVGANFDGGNASLTFSGSANQTFTNNGGANLTGTWIIDKTDGTVTAASSLILGTNQSLNIKQGRLFLNNGS